jgi:hypothetical protein
MDLPVNDLPDPVLNGVVFVFFFVWFAGICHYDFSGICRHLPLLFKCAIQSNKFRAKLIKIQHEDEDLHEDETIETDDRDEYDKGLCWQRSG